MTLAPLHGLHAAHSGPSTQLACPFCAKSGLCKMGVISIKT
ncbi:hypothetical protein AB30_4752 [Escherichia coli 2-210-07_S1_C2]|nr:hypothetical protein AB62_4894 [Escherichia coli 2-210-07_S1_C3]KDW87160.1 hypothetical protein AB30_4752 [Escherichia coli 2-210-07_S1_C2]